MKLTRLSKRSLIGGLVVILLIAGGIAAVLANRSDPVVQPTPIKVKIHTFGDGRHQVYEDITNGVYRTKTGHPGCHYTIASHATITKPSDVFVDVHTDDPAVIVVHDLIPYVTSENCGTWTTDLSAITSSRTSFGAGQYIVNTDMVPGTYTSAGGPTCNYKRLKGFDPTPSYAINPVSSAASPATVTIDKTDGGFESHGCGTWTRQ